MRESAKKAALGVWMAVVAAVAITRAAEQLRRPGALTARGETRWLGWAYRDPALLAGLERTQKFLSGDPICVDSSANRTDPFWLRVMTNYALWREPPAGPCGTTGPRNRVTRIIISADRRIAVVPPARP